MRFLPLTDADRTAMLEAIGVDGVDALYRDVPEAVRGTGLHELPPPAGELEVSRALEALAAENLGT
ncbi:MAG: glycine dehydrogenase, partial [Alphaproteobacteria bacterium]|nr:glycine dehydrogenase [Alphaproteobacteria bacterium]